METASSRAMLKSVRRGFEAAISATNTIVGKPQTSAASRLSSKFVYEVAHAITCDLFPAHHLRVIKVDHKGNKIAGEWLVDACITEDARPSNPHGSGCTNFVERIVFAMESESDPGTQSFSDDFAKLVHLNASVKLYLNGLNQTSSDGMDDYICRRLKYAQDQIRRTRSPGQWFIGFWPSPAKHERYGDVSAWQCPPSHLRTIRLFEFRGTFVEVNGNDTE